MLLQTIILALALSIDAFGIGVSYGMRGIRFKLMSFLIISIIAFSFSLISVVFGNFIHIIFNADFTSFLSVFILIILGIFVMKKGFDKDNASASGKIGKILSNPSSCDFNKSMSIEPKEALYLGTALSLDTLGVGISINFYDFIFPIFIVIFQLIFLFLGISLARQKSFKLSDDKICIISGFILLIIGSFKLILHIV